MIQFRISHLGDCIGFCFASSAGMAIKAFRKAHGIPDEINLVAEVVK